MTKTRIFYPFVGGATIGGSHVSVLKMIAALDRARFTPIIALHREEGALADYIRGLGLDYIFLKDIPIIAPAHSRNVQDASRPGYLLRSVPRMIKRLRDLKINIVHTNDGRMHGSWALPARLAGCRFVWHHRQGPDASGVNKLAPILADRILSVSEFSRPERPIRTIDSRFEVVRSPFDLSITPPDAAACHAALCDELHVPKDAVLLGYFGVLNHRKRPLHFVEVIAQLKQALPERPIHGLIFGKVENEDTRLDEACLARAAELGCSENLHLMGHRDPVVDAMAGIDALLIPALNEPFGRTLIEAMHLGTPVVATRHGGNPEAIIDGETGFLVDASDPAAFVPPILQLTANPAKRAQVIAAAQADVHAKFGLQKHVDQVSAVYDALVNRTV